MTVTKLLSLRGNLIKIIVSIFAIAWPIIFQIKATFKEERKENARQFLYNAELESVKKTVEYLETAIWITEESMTVSNMSEERCMYMYKDRRHDIFNNLTNDIKLKLTSIEIYIPFIPQLKPNLNNVNKRLDVYREEGKVATMKYSTTDPDDVEEYENCEMHVEYDIFLNELKEFRRKIIKIYGTKIAGLIRTTEIDENEKKWYQFYKKK